jgi:glycosyltransferase involved in cell wall biosynthesis
MKILILTDNFPPAFGPRMGYLCKYLKRQNVDYYVIAEKIEDSTFAFLADPEHSLRIAFYKSESRLEWLKVWLTDLFFDTKNRKIFDEALKATETDDYDLILCSAYRTFPLPAAARLARKIGLPLVVDLRDIIEQWADNEYISKQIPKLLGLEKIFISIFRKNLLNKRNKVLRQATAVTTVSPWHVETLKGYNPNTHLIYNGFDPELFYPAPIASPVFYITYTGRIMSLALQNPTLLFQAVERLATESVISPEKFKIRWFTNAKTRQMIWEMMEGEGESVKGEWLKVKEFLEFHDYVAAAEIPKILNESAVLLLLTNKSGENGPQGIMTTKFFEYLAVEKPILCVRGDEACLEEAINQTRSGLSAHNSDEVYEFIKTLYGQWLSTGETSSNAKREEIRKLSRETQAEQFINIFQNIR